MKTSASTGSMEEQCFAFPENRDCTLVKRATLVLLFALGISQWGLSWAQTSRALPKIGELWNGTEAHVVPWRQPYIDGMNSLGWIEGQTAQFVVRYDEGDPSRLPALARELVALGVDVIVVGDGALPLTRQATTKIPIVCLDMYDPIAEGVAVTLARPGGNVTGVSWQSIDTAAKRLELTKELIPSLRRVALLTAAGDPGARIEAKGFRTSAAKSSLDLRVFEVQSPAELPNALAQITKYAPEALIVSTNTLTLQNLERIAGYARSARIPAISEAPEFAEAGFVLTYGPNVGDAYRLGALQVDRVLRGRKPAELPFEQPVKFDLTVNMKAAKALGLTVPESIIVRTTMLIR